MMRKPLAFLMVLLLKGYQYVISPMIVAEFGTSVRCRFHPTCSTYAIEAYKAHGFLKGTWLMVARLLKCQPFCAGGEDPVPKTFTFFKQRS